MKFHTEYLKFHTRKHREYIHITPQIDAIDRGEAAERLVDALDEDLRFRVRIEPGPVGDGFRRRGHAG